MTWFHVRMTRFKRYCFRVPLEHHDRIQLVHLSSLQFYRENEVTFHQFTSSGEWRCNCKAKRLVSMDKENELAKRFVLFRVICLFHRWIKEWKRTLKNYKNVVSIFAASETAYKKEANAWLGPGGRKAHKAARMFWIDCSDKETAKICKKYKQQPDPVNVQYWREGLFYKVFKLKLNT